MFADRELGAENSTSFELRKWYLDCVDAEGNAAIAYWAKLRWRYINLYYRRVAVNGVERRCTEISWRQSVSMEASAPPIRRRLFEGPDGIVDWSCEMPRAKARIGDVRGDGYAELLRMTGPPWKLPIDELRWGRFIGGETSVAWIEWRGPLPQKLVFRDGVERDGVVHDDRVELPLVGQALACPDRLKPVPQRAVLHFGRDRVLADRTVGDALPLLKWLFPRRIRNARERKWCSRATLGEVSGWAIHEIVSFG